VEPEAQHGSQVDVPIISPYCSITERGVGPDRK
jgi:hypothetical protein